MLQYNAEPRRLAKIAKPVNPEIQFNTKTRPKNCAFMLS